MKGRKRETSTGYLNCDNITDILNPDTGIANFEPEKWFPLQPWSLPSGKPFAARNVPTYIQDLCSECKRWNTETFWRFDIRINWMLTYSSTAQNPNWSGKCTLRGTPGTRSKDWMTDMFKFICCIYMHIWWVSDRLFFVQKYISTQDPGDLLIKELTLQTEERE